MKVPGKATVHAPDANTLPRAACCMQPCPPSSLAVLRAHSDGFFDCGEPGNSNKVKNSPTVAILAAEGWKDLPASFHPGMLFPTLLIGRHTTYYLRDS